MLSEAPRCRRGIAALVLSFAAWPALAAKPQPQWQGRVMHVSDGDSLWVKPADAEAKPVEVRLADVDAPELCQPWGPQARDALKEKVDGKLVSLRVVGRDSFGRTLAKVSLDGESVGAWLVQEGHAWSQRTRWDRGPLVKQERMAHALRRGLHAQRDAMMPKDFRRANGPCPRPS